MRSLWFYDEVYQQNIYILETCSAEQLQDFVRKTFHEPKYKSVRCFNGRCVHRDGKGTIIALRDKFTFSPVDLGTLSHECFHAVEYIMEERGMRLVHETSEAYAYLLGSLVKRSLCLLRGKK
jgi:hypothetical protein